MNATEIVMHVMESDRERVVFELFREGIREAGTGHHVKHGSSRQSIASMPWDGACAQRDNRISSNLGILSEAIAPMRLGRIG